MLLLTGAVRPTVAQIIKAAILKEMKFHMLSAICRSCQAIRTPGFDYVVQ